MKNIMVDGTRSPSPSLRASSPGVSSPGASSCSASRVILAPAPTAVRGAGSGKVALAAGARVGGCERYVRHRNGIRISPNSINFVLPVTPRVYQSAAAP